MDGQPQFLVTDPAHFEVSYRINPWMRPSAWRADSAALRAQAGAAAAELRAALTAAGAKVEIIEPVGGLPDLVFPANAAVVLDGRVLLARFRHPERRGEEPVYRAVFEALQRRGRIAEIVETPEGIFQEGAGDCIWDADRQLFWAGHGPRSSKASCGLVERVFGQAVVPLELASERFYHLDTCFCPLEGGVVLYHPAAFRPEALDAIRAHVPESLRMEAAADEAAAFCVNAVNIGRHVVMARAPEGLRGALAGRGFHVVEVDLAPFILSGGGAYCMTLRLDRASRSAPAAVAAA